MKEFLPENIRNVVVLSHGGAGKTSLIEAMLYKAKMISRMGKVEDGNTVMDYEPEEIQRKTSISLSLAYLDWKGTKINIIDTPGYSDFQGEVLGALRAADAVLLVVCAVSGVEIGTENMWRLAQEHSLPVLFVVNKIDRENADLNKVITQLQESFSRGIVLISEDIIKGKEGREAEREKLIEALADVNDVLLEKYINGEEIGEEEIRKTLVEGVKKRQIFPVLPVSALACEGIEQLLDSILEYLPSPVDRGPIKGTSPSSGEEIVVNPRDDEPTCAFVFKTVTDPYVGKLSFIRVFSGTLDTDSSLINVNKNTQQKIGQIYLLIGKQQQVVGKVHAGDICAVPKLAETSTGDTLCAPSRLVLLPSINYPEPVYQLAIAPKSREDEEKLSTGLNRLTEEDPSFRWWRDNEIKQTVIAGMGDVHLEVIVDRLKRKFGVDVELTTPKVPYRETIRKAASAQGKYKRQTGGHGQYGDVWLLVEPLERGAGFEFVNKIVGGVVPRQYIPSVEKGVQKALSEGILAGYPVVDVRVTLYDGSYHPVDSSDIAFQIAASIAFKNAAQQADPVLLEPIMNVTVYVPKAFTGDVLGGLNSKRGRIIGIESESPLIDKIIAQVPLAEMLKYAIDLRSITGGRGTFTMSFSHYEEVPPHIAQQIIESSRKEER
ncbi:elongation factor G [bacterium]|nr:elongation factor G [bacterium]